jgi:hypothetical protein
MSAVIFLLNILAIGSFFVFQRAPRFEARPVKIRSDQRR